jgi:EPS-associated MarR family transcriptional regulator
MNEERHYQVLKHLAANPQATQRDLAKALGLSLGSTNFCIRAVIDQGWLKVQNFRNSRNKRAYAYLLTPDGIEAKARLTARFLQRKRAEYAALKTEIEHLTAELQTQPE